MKLRWTRYAASDMVEIRNFISKDSANYADAVTDRIFDRISQLEYFPESGQMVPEYERKDIREIFVHSFRIIYMILPRQIWLLTIAHGSNPLPQTPPLPEQ